MKFVHAERIPLLEFKPQRAEDVYWEKTLSDGTQLQGIRGDGSHTHTGPDFVSMKNEATGSHARWNVPMTDTQKAFYGTGQKRCPY